MTVDDRAERFAGTAANNTVTTDEDTSYTFTQPAATSTSPTSTAMYRA